MLKLPAMDLFRLASAFAICVCWASVSFTQSSLAKPVLKLAPQFTCGDQHSSRAREIFEFVAAMASHKECRAVFCPFGDRHVLSG